jgi:hypothetical protein
MVSEIEGKRARAHVNRLRKIAPVTLAEPANPEAVLWPERRRLLLKIIGRRTTESGQVQYQVKHADRAGFVWQNEERLPDVVKAAYELCASQRGEENVVGKCWGRCVPGRMLGRRPRPFAIHSDVPI